ncbi:MAG: WD40 repeat domain-containing protein [Phycisphaerae bacterium]
MRRAILLAALFVTGCEPGQSPFAGPADGARDYGPVSLRLTRRDTLATAEGEVRALAFSPGGRLLAVSEAVDGGLRGALSLWDVRNRRRLIRTETDSPYTHLSFTPDSDELIAMSRAAIDIRSVNSLERTRGIEHPQRRWTDMDLSPDGRLLAAVAWEDSNVHVFVVSEGTRLTQLSGDFSAVAFAPDGELLAAAAGEELHLFDTQTWRQRRLPTPPVLRAGPPIPVMDVLFGPEADFVFTAGAMGRTWNTADGEAIATLQPPPTIRAVAISPDRRVLAVAENDLSFWELPQGRLLEAVTDHEGGPSAVAFSPDGETCASASLDDRSVVLWKVDVGR